MTRTFPRQDRGHHFAIAFTIILISFHSALADGLQCRDISTANVHELLATVDRQSIPYGGGVQVGRYDCDYYPGQKTCDWETTLEDDQMLDRDHRLIYVFSSHLTGSGSWGDPLVFGCVSGQVKKLYLEQFDTQQPTNPYTIFDSAPPALRPMLKEYMEHPKPRRPEWLS
jgi:hypothetical protein